MNKLYLLLLSMFISLKSFGAIPSSTDYPDLVFTPIEGTQECSVKANSRNISGDIAIPAEVLIGADAYKITTIAQGAFVACMDITSVVIPDGVTSIGGSAFGECCDMKSVVIPNSVRTIGSHAFSRCSALASIIIPEGVTIIEDGTFSSCESLKSVTIPKGVESIGIDSFLGCSSLPVINLPEGLLTLKGSSFERCNSLKSVTIPESLTSLASYALLNCNALKSVVFLSEQCPLLGERMFNSSVSVCVPESAKAAYAAALKVNNADFDESRIVDYKDFEGEYPYLVFTTNADGTCSVKANPDNKPTGDIVIPSTILKEDGVIYKVTALDDWAFAGCKGITSVVIPDGVKKISDHAFYGCTSLASVTIPDEVEIIDKSAFNGTALKQVSLPANLKFIGEYAFEAVVTLESIVIPASVETIGTSAFVNCQGLKKFVFLGEQCPTWTLDIMPFVSCPIYVPESAKDAYAEVLKEKGINVNRIMTYIPANDYTTLVFTPIAGEDGACSVKANSENKPTGELIIPAEVSIGNQFYTVTAIGKEAFQSCTSLTSVVIPEGVTEIGKSAFLNCTNLVSINIPQGVTAIGDQAFYKCGTLKSIEIPAGVVKIGYDAFRASGLTDITIPATVTSLGEWAFESCTSLETVVFEDRERITLSTGIFKGCTALKSVTLGTGITSIPGDTFSNCRGLASIVIPEGVTSIGGNAFDMGSDEGSLTSVTLPSTLKTIDDSAFLWNKFESIVIPESVTSIGNKAFMSCKNLTSIVIPKAVTEIHSEAFAGCEKLKEVVVKATDVPSGENLMFGEPNEFTGTIYVPAASLDAYMEAEYWRDYMGFIAVSVKKGDKFTYGGFKYEITSLDPKECRIIGYEGEPSELTIPASANYLGTDYSVTAIGDKAFQSCTSLTSVVIPEGVTAIGNSAFRICTKLASITIPDGVTTIGAYAFGSCVFTEITIPDGVTTIGDNAFFGCTKLESVTVPGSVTTMGESIFGNCTGLTTVEIKEGVTTIGTSAFSYCKELASVTIPGSVTAIGATAFQNCSSLASIEIPASVTSIGNSAFLNCSNLTSINIPQNVTTINVATFSGCSSLASIEIPANVTSIGESAFRDCRALASINIPQNVTSIDKEAFMGCAMLASITISEGVATIGESAFFGCSKLESVTIPGSVTSIGDLAFAACGELASVKIPGSVTSIGNYAFQNCSSLTSVVIEEGVNTIGDDAFGSCIMIKDVVIPKTVTSIGRNAFDGIKETDAKVYIYSSAEFNETIFSEDWVFTIYVVNSDMVDYYKGKYPYLIVRPMLTIQGSDSEEPMLVEAGKAVELNMTLPDGYNPTLLWSVGGESEGSEELIINSRGEENVVTAKVYDANNPDIYATVKLRGYLAGDSNDNGFVTIDDAVTTANHIVGNTPDKFLEVAADVMNPELTDPMTGRVIDIRDVVATVDIVLAAPAPNVAEPNDIHYAPAHLTDCLGINADGDCLLLTLTGSGAFSALQADVTLPEGAILTDVHAGDRLTSSHSVMYRMIDDRTVRVVVFAMSLDTFMPGNSVVRLQLDAPVSGGVTAANVIASDSEGRGYRLGVNGNGTTGIDGIGNDGNGVNIGAVNGAITVDGAEGATVEVYGIDGRRVASFVADGDSVRLDVVPGVYLVRVGTAKAVKIVVR